MTTLNAAQRQRKIGRLDPLRLDDGRRGHHLYPFWIYDYYQLEI